jgi:hypothetical protein
MGAAGISMDSAEFARGAADLTERAVGVGQPRPADPLDAVTLLALRDANMAVFDAQDEADMPALENALTWAAALVLHYRPDQAAARARDLLDDGDVVEVLDDGLDIWFEQAVEALACWCAEGDGAALVRAEVLLRSCLLACGGDHRNRFAFAGNLASVFRAHHERTSDPAWIAAAVTLARTAVTSGRPMPGRRPGS